MGKYLLLPFVLIGLSSSITSANKDESDDYLIMSNTTGTLSVTEYRGLDGKVWQRVEEITCTTEVREWPKQEQKNELKKNEKETQS